METSIKLKNIGDTKMNSKDYFIKALECNALGDKKGARINYSKAIKLDPKYAEAYVNRGNIIYEISLKKPRLCRGFEKFIAITNYIRATIYNPNMIEAYVNIGVVCSSMTGYLTAIENYNQAININPNNAIVYYYKAMANEGLRNYQLAIDDYNKAIEINSEYVEAYLNRGILYNRLKDDDQATQKAIDDCTKAIEINPRYAQAYFVRGLILYNSGDEKNGLIDSSQAVIIDHENYYNLPEEILLEIKEP